MQLERIFVPNRDTYISSIRPRQSFQLSPALHITHSTISEEIALIQFDQLQYLPLNAVVEQALLSCYVLSSIPSSVDLSIHPLLSYWQAGTATWHNPPIIDDSFTTFSGILLPHSVFSVAITGLVQEWLTGSLRNRGLALIGDDTLSLKIASVNQKNIRLWPQLLVKFKLKGEEITIISDVLVWTDEEEYVADATWRHTRTQNVSKSALTTFVIANLGSQQAQVFLSVSPDETLWLADSKVYELDPGESVRVFPDTYLGYIRMSYRSNTPTSLKFFFYTQQAT